MSSKIAGYMTRTKETGISDERDFGLILHYLKRNVRKEMNLYSYGNCRLFFNIVKRMLRQVENDLICMGKLSKESEKKDGCSNQASQEDA